MIHAIVFEGPYLDSLQDKRRVELKQAAFFNSAIVTASFTTEKMAAEPSNDAAVKFVPCRLVEVLPFNVMPLWVSRTVEGKSD